MSKKNYTFYDFIELSKPRILFFCVLMTAGGVIIAPGSVSVLTFVMTLLGTACSVASANAFNMIYERKTDRLMRRTKFRPLAMKRIKTYYAVFFAILLGILSIVILTCFVNLLTAVLAVSAIFAYCLVYTPLKFKTPLALVVGAFPGAMPPLLGWTAVTNKIDIEGLILFGVLFAWQMPHFIAISIYHKEDYISAGIKVVSVVRGDYLSKIQAVIWSFVLFIFSLLLVPLKVGGFLYLAVAIILGIWFLSLSIKGLEKKVYAGWPRKFFLASLVYLPVLVLGLVVDRLFWFIMNL